MKEIATAEKVIENIVKFASVNDTINCTVYSLSKVMIDFAKLHVEAALKAAFEDAPCGSSTDIVTCEELHEAIINSYPLDNIK